MQNHKRNAPKGLTKFGPFVMELRLGAVVWCFLVFFFVPSPFLASRGHPWYQKGTQKGNLFMTFYGCSSPVDSGFSSKVLVIIMFYMGYLGV